MKRHHLKENEMAGFEIIGYRQKDGSLRLGDEEEGELMNDFPKSVITTYGTFSLEDVRLNDENGNLPSDHPGKNIEWGIYA